MTTTKYREILAAAAQIFRQKGYHATTVRDIADAAGLVKGSLYHHIESKQQLLEDILLEGMGLLIPNVGEIVKMDVSAAVKAEAAIVCHVNSFGRGEDVWSVFIAETTNLPAEIRPRVLGAIDEYRNQWFAILNQGKREGLFAPDLPNTLILNGILGMCNWIYRWYIPGRAHGLSEVGSVFARMLLFGISDSPNAQGRTGLVSQGSHSEPG